MNNDQKYMLRYAAGIYWLVKMNQQEAVYEAPMTMNDCGAMLWKGLMEGLTTKELSVVLQKEYGIDSKEAMTDINQFMEKLSTYKIVMNE